MHKPPRDESTQSHMVTVRISDELFQALEDAVVRMREERRGANVERSDVVREILGRALLSGRTSTGGRAESPDLPPRRSSPARRASRALSSLLSGGRGGASERQRNEKAATLLAGLRLVYAPGPYDQQQVPVISEELSLFVAEVANGALAEDDDREAFVDAIYEFPKAAVAALSDLLRYGTTEDYGPNRLTVLAELLYFAMRRTFLRETLEKVDWNLADAAQELGMRHGSGPILRMIRELDLDEPYEAARAAGLIRPGPRGPRK